MRRAGLQKLIQRKLRAASICHYSSPILICKHMIYESINSISRISPNLQHLIYLLDIIYGFAFGQSPWKKITKILRTFLIIATINIFQNFFSFRWELWELWRILGISLEVWQFHSPNDLFLTP